MGDILKLISSTLEYSKCYVAPDVLFFLAETVTAVIEDDVVMEKDEVLAMLQDAGLGDIEEEEFYLLAETISVMTGSDVDRPHGAMENTGDIVDDDGTCELCERDARRTFHHLIPKETHSKYLKKKTLPDNIKAVATDIGIDPSMSRVWLNTYGTMICGPCHRAVHNAASNEDLAEKYNTVDLLLEHPKIFAFAEYNSKQPVRYRCAKSPRVTRAKDTRHIT